MHSLHESMPLSTGHAHKKRMLTFSLSSNWRVWKAGSENSKLDRKMRRERNNVSRVWLSSKRHCDHGGIELTARRPLARVMELQVRRKHNTSQKP